MALEIPDRWVLLRVERQRSALMVSARDDRGRRRSGLVPMDRITPRGARRIVRFTAPPAIVKLIEEALADLPARRSPSETAPIALPLFVELGPRLQRAADAADPGLPKALAERVQVVAPAAEEVPRRPARPARRPKTRSPRAGAGRLRPSGALRAEPIFAPSGLGYGGAGRGAGARRAPAVAARNPRTGQTARSTPRPWKATPRNPVEPPARRVDVVLQSLETSPARAVQRDRTLRRGGLYRLRVHIGGRSRGSLMTEPPPAIDRLLPPSGKGHELHVVVYEKDFSLLRTPRVQTLRLPEAGGSEPVYFDLRAPARKGKARLRIKIYYRNQLLQSFLLEAVIADQEQKVEKPSPALRVDLVYSRTERFANLNVFKPRALSIGVNKDPGGDSHLFMFKVGNSAEGIDLGEKTLDEQIGRFRELLLGATYDGDQPRFPETLPRGTPGEAFYKVIRELAEAGGDLYDALYVRMSPALKKRMREIAQDADGTIQLVRDDPNFVFPWTVLYDFSRPEWPEGGIPPPVCLGLQEGRPCSHGPADEVYCVNGFWGIRHSLEVLLARSGTTEDEVTVVERGSREAAVCLAMGVEDDSTLRLVAELEKTLNTGIRKVDGSEDLLDLLWDGEKRPALLIVLGHLETEAIADEPRGPRIVLASGKKWLQARSVTAREKREGEWEEQPRSVVLLMACGSAATEIDTLNDFVTALSSAGAAAVVGTECLVFTGLVSSFARDLTSDLWEGKITLGAAIQGFRRRLVAAGNPLGFVFSATGNADLVFKWKEGNS